MCGINVIYMHTYTQWNISHKKDEIIPFVTTWMDLEGIIISKISQRKTKLYDFTCVWNVKNQTKKAETGPEIQKTAGSCQMGWVGGMSKMGTGEWEIQASGWGM